MPKKNTTAAQPYELFTFARRHDIPVEEARRILETYGIDRVASDVAAREVAHSNRTTDYSAVDLKP